MIDILKTIIFAWACSFIMMFLSYVGGYDVPPYEYIQLTIIVAAIEVGKW